MCGFIQHLTGRIEEIHSEWMWMVGGLGEKNVNRWNPEHEIQGYKIYCDVQYRVWKKCIPLHESLYETLEFYARDVEL